MVLSRKKLKEKLRGLLADSVVSSESKSTINGEEINKQLEILKERLKDSNSNKQKRPRKKKKTPLLEGNEKKEKDELEGEEKEEKEKSEDSNGAINQNDTEQTKTGEKKKKKKKKKQNLKKKNNKKKEEEKLNEQDKVVIETPNADKRTIIELKQSENIIVSEENIKKVYVGGIPYYSTKDDIKSFFESCGTVSDVDCMKFPETGKFRGIAILTFKTEAAAKRAIALDGSDMGGFFLKIQPYKGKSANKPDFSPQIIQGYNRIYVGNLAWDITEEDLKKFFENFKISKIKFGTDKLTGDFKGYAHVDFEETNSVLGAIKLDQKLVRGRPVRISCAVPAKSNNNNNNISEGKNVIMQEVNEKMENMQVQEGTKKKKRTCYECGLPGHLSSECPSNKNNNNNYEGNNVIIQEDEGQEENTQTQEGTKKKKRRTCYECGLPGHLSSECPSNNNNNIIINEGNNVIIQQDQGQDENTQLQEGNKKKKRRTCYECGTPGHLSSECPNKNNNNNNNNNNNSEGTDVILQEYNGDKVREDEQGMGDVQEVSKKKKNKRRTCYECGIPGHLSSECPNKKS